MGWEGPEAGAKEQQHTENLTKGSRPGAAAGQGGKMNCKEGVMALHQIPKQPL